jgi:hypothetical protein
MIPGREPSFADVLFNTLGAAVGLALAGSAPTWRRPGARLAGVLPVAWALAATSIFALTGFLYGPAFTEDTYYGGWTPRFGHLEWYGGRVLKASLGRLEIPQGLIPRSSQVRHQLLSGAPLVVQAQAGPRPAALAPLLAIDDAHQREILLLGIDKDDLVYRHRTRAIAWGLVGPELRIHDAMREIAWGTPVTLSVVRAGDGYCVRVNTTDRCGLGSTIGTGWALLLGSQPLPLWLRPVLNVTWVAIIMFPLGLWARFSSMSGAGVALALAGFLALPAFFGLLPTALSESLGALVGLAVGMAGRATDNIL